MKKITPEGFYIERRFFPLSKVGLRDNFSIKSVPYDYKVNFIERENSFAMVNQYFKGRTHNVLFIDKNVYRLYKEYIIVPKDKIFQAKADETFKTLEGATKLIDFLQKNNFTKTDKLVVLGGGVVQDVAALVGALYKRGISWIFFPTTLLAMCDSCIGAKASINFGYAKNQLGVFYAPKEIYIDVNFLKTLDDKQIKSGLGEIFKLCVSGGGRVYNKFMEKVGNGKVKNLLGFKHLIKLALSVKKSVIEIDEFDDSFRKSLNYGHTFGHALEVLTDYEVPHGQAVVAGMAIVNELSAKKFFLSRTDNQKLLLESRKLIDYKFKKKLSQVDTSCLLKLLQQDKKITGNILNLVMLKNVGHLIFYPIKINQIFIITISKIIKKIFQE